MARFEYKYLVVNGSNLLNGRRWLSMIDDERVEPSKITLHPYLDKLGSEGWEVVAKDGNTWVLKREIP